MKSVLSRLVILGFMILGGPMLASAATPPFAGPTADPPGGNVPGVIWNMTGSSQTQAGAKIDIDGLANFGISSGISDIDGDFGLENAKAFRIDYNGAATYNMGNWGGAGGMQAPLTFTINGDIRAVDFGGSTGQRGRVQATQYCFNPGNPADCITTWPVVNGDITSVTAGVGLAGGGTTGDVTLTYDKTFFDNRYINIDGDTMTGRLTLTADPISSLEAATKGYVDSKVKKGGDTMTGALTLSGNPTVNLHAATKQYVDTGVAGRVNKAGDTMTGLLTVDNASTLPVAGVFKGQWQGVIGYGVGVPGAVGVQGTGFNGLNYGELGGDGFGVRGQGINDGVYGSGDDGVHGVGMYGIRGESPFMGGVFSNTSNGANAWLAYAGYGLYTGYPVHTGSLTVSGDISADGNTLSDCAWTGYVSQYSVVICPASRPIMNGIQKDGSQNMHAYCCEL